MNQPTVIGKCPHCNVQLFGTHEGTDPVLARGPRFCWKCAKPLPEEV